VKTLYVIEFLAVSGLLCIMIGKAIKWGTKGWPGPEREQWNNPMDERKP
jgi:hypothetical protein